MTVESELDSILAVPRLADLVRAYLSEPNRGFAGNLFNTWGTNAPNEVGSDDLLALGLLDVPVGSSAIRILLIEQPKRDRISSLLKQISPQLSLWEAREEIGRDSPAQELWEELDSVPGLAEVRVSKLMARKRPHLIPIQDRRVRALVPSGQADYWAAFNEALSDKGCLRRIRRLREDVGSDATELRILDVAIWMLGSNARNARDVREECNLSRVGYTASTLVVTS